MENKNFVYLLVDEYTYDNEPQDVIVIPCISKEVAIRELKERYEWYIKESYISQFVNEDGSLNIEEFDENWDAWDVNNDSVSIYLSAKDTSLNLYIKREEIKK